MHIGGGRHLTYCTNVHPGDSLLELRRLIVENVAAVKARVAPDEPFGVGLRLSARTARELARPGAVAELRALLDERGMYVFTLNGFVHGAFRGAVVKHRVYEPDWQSDERLRYTDQLATLLAALLPAGVDGSISTVPGGLGGDPRTMAVRLEQHALTLARIFDATGKHIRTALEPEPGCLLSTSADAVRFFDEHLRGELARRYLGVCLDACHAAVEFDDARSAFARLREAGIVVAKVQLSTALRVDLDGVAPLELARFCDGVHLHQVVEKRGDTRRRWLDLPDALAALRDERGGEARQWRVHFHVPIFAKAVDGLRTTQAELEALLLAQPDAAHFEVETYSWQLLPAPPGPGELTDGIGRELAWARARL